MVAWRAALAALLGLASVTHALEWRPAARSSLATPARTRSGGHSRRGCSSAQVRMQSATEGAVLLSATDLSRSHDGERYQFEDVSFTLAEGAKIGLVGVNGVGKSSMLRVLAGVDSPESGAVQLTRGVRLVYVEQDPRLPAGATADHFIYGASAPPMLALRAFREASAEASAAESAGEAVDGAALEAATRAMDESGAWGLEADVDELCAELRVASLLTRQADSLSGGERKRVALAAALLQQAIQSWEFVVPPHGWRDLQFSPVSPLGCDTPFCPCVTALL